MPSACANFGHQLPAVGTKVIFRTVIDAKTNKIRAEAVSKVATEIQDNAQQSHPETTEATPWKDDWSHLQNGIGVRPIGANPRLYPPDI